MERKEGKIIEDDRHRELLSDLYEKGIIDEDGNIVEE